MNKSYVVTSGPLRINTSYGWGLIIIRPLSYSWGLGSRVSLGLWHMHTRRQEFRVRASVRASVRVRVRVRVGVRISFGHSSKRDKSLGSGSGLDRAGLGLRLGLGLGFVSDITARQN